MARALAHRPGRPGPDTTVPSHGIELDSWTASSGLLAEYREVVGSTATQPIGFPTVVATRLLRDLMGLGRIPVSGRGLVHVASHLWTSGRLPIIHFGFWRDTLRKWRDEGHLANEEAVGWADGNPVDRAVGRKLGFDFNWNTCFVPDRKP